MSIRVLAYSCEDVTFEKGSKDHLIGGVGRLIKKEVDIDIYAFSQAGPEDAPNSIDERFTITISNTIYQGLSTLERIEGSFLDDGFIKGDYVLLEDGATSQNLYIKTITDNLITFTTSASSFTDRTEATITLFVNQLQYTAIELKTALNTNSDSSIISIIDNSVPTFSGVIGGTLVSKAFLSGYILPRGAFAQTAAYVSDSSVIRITLYQHIGPFFEDYEQCDGEVPSFFFENECINWWSNIKLLKNINNPNESREADVTTSLGNTGWQGELYNGGANNYTIEDLTIKTGGKDIPGIQVDKPTLITFTLKASVLLSSNSRYQLCFSTILQGDGHKNKATSYTENVYFENCVANADDGSPAQGTKFLQDGEGFESVEFTYVDSATATCVAKFSPGAHLRNVILGQEKKLFTLWVNTEIKNEADIYNDQEVPVPIFCGNLITDPNLDALLRLEPWAFYEHDETQASESYCAYRGFATDDVFAVQNIGVRDLLAEITNITVGLYVQQTSRSGTEEFVLEEYTFKTEGLSIDQVSSTTSRGYLLSSVDDHNKVSVTRNTNKDGAYRYLKVVYGWRPRWEYWIKKDNVTDAFIDVGQPNDGKNEEWHRFDITGLQQREGAKIFFRSVVTIKSKETGDYNTETMQTVIRIGDFEEAMDNQVTWTLPTQKTLKEDLTDISPSVQRDANTIMEYDFVSSPAHGGVALYYGECKAENYESGVLSTHEISSEKLPITGLLKPLTGQTKAELTEVNATTLRLRFAIDPQFINKTTLSFYPRIGRKTKEPSWCCFTAKASINADFDVPVYMEIGDGTILYGASISHTYTDTGKRMVVGYGDFTTADLYLLELTDWVDLSRIPVLDTLDLHDNFELKQVYFGTTVVDNINCRNCNIQELDLRNISFKPGGATQLDFGNNYNLSFVEFRTTPDPQFVTSIDFSGCDLEYIDFTNVMSNAMTLNISGNNMNTGELDQILTDIAATAKTSVTVIGNGTNDPIGALGAAAKLIIEGLGGTVTVNT